MPPAIRCVCKQRRAEAVVERQDGHRAVVGADAGVGEDVLGVHQDVVVRDHHALHVAGRAGSEHDGGQIAARIDFRGRDEAVHRRAGGSGVSGTSSSTPSRSAQGWTRAWKRAETSKPLHAGRGDDPLEGRLAAIDGKGDGAQAGADRAQIGGDEEGAVFGEQAHAVAAAEAARPQPARPSRRPPREARRG